jgi:hypothetical protein
VDPHAINVMSGKSYEQEFDLEQQRMKVSAPASTPSKQLHMQVAPLFANRNL